MFLIDDCQTKGDIADWVGDVGETILMWLWRAMIPSSCLFKMTNVFFAAVIYELDDLISDVDDE